MLAATKLTERQLNEHRVVILGAGSAAIGICDKIVAAMVLEGTLAVRHIARDWLKLTVVNAGQGVEPGLSDKLRKLPQLYSGKLLN